MTVCCVFSLQNIVALQKHGIDKSVFTFHMNRMYVWMTLELLSTVFHSYQDDCRVMTKGCEHWSFFIKLTLFTPYLRTDQRKLALSVFCYTLPVNYIRYFSQLLGS